MTTTGDDNGWESLSWAEAEEEDPGSDYMVDEENESLRFQLDEAINKLTRKEYELSDAEQKIRDLENEIYDLERKLRDAEENVQALQRGW